MASVFAHNKCSNFELASPAYFGRNTIWHILHDQKVDANVMTGVSFGREIFKVEFASALIYKLQRKRRLESNDQTDTDNTSTKDISTSLQLLVIWRSNSRYRDGLRVRALLIKHSNAIIWNEDILEKLHSMQLALLRDDIIVKDTWLLDNTTVLMTVSKWREMDYATVITISEGIKKDDSMEPLWVSSDM
jgi:hypothetical protein